MKKIYLLITLIFIVIATTLNAQLTYQWSVGEGSSTGAEYGQCIATDAAGNVYVSGVFTGTVDFDPGAGVTSLSSLSGSQDIFLAKYDLNGNFVWVKQIAGTSDEKPYDIYVDASNIYLVGIFKGTVDFDPGTSSTSYTCNGGGVDGDGFCAKYDLSGNYVWAFRVGGTGNDRILGVTVDISGNVYICGFTSGTVDMDPGTPVVNLVSTLYNSFFAKYTSAGAYSFAKQLSGDYSEANDIQIDASLNIYVAGDWSESVDFDPGTGTVTMGTSSATQIDGYFAKYSSTGVYSWAKRIGGIGVDYITQIALCSSNNIRIGGQFSSTCDFDPSTTSTANLVSAGGSDAFYAKYDNSGNYQWAYGLGGTSNDYVNGLRLDASSNIFLTGKFTGTNIDFDPGAGTSLLTGSSTGYIAEYDNSGIYLAAYSTGSATSEGRGLYVGSSVYFTGSFQGTVDFDFGTNVGSQTSSGGDDIFIAKYNVCAGFPPIQPGSISGNTTICEGSVNTYSISTVAGATSYTWTLPSGWAGSSTLISINATAGAASGNITITADNSCGASTPQTFSVNVNPLPIIPALAFSDTNYICANYPINLSISGGNGLTTGWYTDSCNGTSIGTGNPLSLFAPQLTTTYYTNWQNGCGNSGCVSVTVNITLLPLPPTYASTDTNNLNSNYSGNINLSIYGGFGLTVGWYTDSCNGTPIGTGNPLTLPAPQATTTYYSNWQNGCGNSSCASITVIVNTTGISNNETNKYLEIYPNPAKDKFAIKYTLVNDGNIEISFHNILGEKIVDVVNSFQPKGQYKSEINLSSIPSGVYALKIIIDGCNTIIKKVIISK